MISGRQMNGQNNAKAWDCDWGCLFGGQIHTVIWGRGLQKEWNPLVSLTVKLTSLGKLDSCKDKMHDWKRSVIASTISEYALGTGLKILHLKHCTSHVNLRKIVKSPLQRFVLIYRYPTCLDSECWRHILKLLVRWIDWSRKKLVWLVYVISKYSWRLSAMFRSKPRSLDAFASQ